MSLVRRAVGAIVGYAIFAAAAFLLFRLSGRDPHAAQPAAFIVVSVGYGMFFAALGGYASAVSGGGNARVQSGLVAGLIALGAIVSLLAGSNGGSMWSRLAALFLMAPSAMLGALVRAKRKRPTGTPS